jgi:DNA repair protein RadA/Sms
VVLLSGEPGIGKSTLVLQVIQGVLATGRRALLVTAEESIDQVSLRGSRLGVALDRFEVAASSSVTEVVAACEGRGPDLLVVDSIQTLGDPSHEQPPGSLIQVRECAAALVRHAKQSGTAVLLVGHVTKEGTVAGPKALEHIVDAVLGLEGERGGGLRLLRASKNRFGSCEETGVFVMGQRGLEAVEDPSAMFLDDRRSNVPGSVVFPGLEGSRPMLVEIQALVTPSSVPHQPRRVPLGIDARRLSLLIAVLQQRASVPLGHNDVFIAAAGGLRVREPAADLAVCMSLHSAARNVPIGDGVVAFGEVGLGGEVRRVPGTERRLAEAARLGFRVALVPPGVNGASSIEVVRVGDLESAAQALDMAAARA